MEYKKQCLNVIKPLQLLIFRVINVITKIAGGITNGQKADN